MHLECELLNVDHLPRNGAPFNIALLIVLILKSFSATGTMNDTAVVDMAQAMFTKPHTNNNTIWYLPVPVNEFLFFYTYLNIHFPNG